MKTRREADSAEDLGQIYCEMRSKRKSGKSNVPCFKFEPEKLLIYIAICVAMQVCQWSNEWPVFSEFNPRRTAQVTKFAASSIISSLPTHKPCVVRRAELGRSKSRLGRSNPSATDRYVGKSRYRLSSTRELISSRSLTSMFTKNSPLCHLLRRPLAFSARAENNSGREEIENDGETLLAAEMASIGVGKAAAPRIVKLQEKIL